MEQYRTLVRESYGGDPWGISADYGSIYDETAARDVANMLNEKENR